MGARAAAVLVIGAASICTLTGCGGSGGTSSAPTAHPGGSTSAGTSTAARPSCGTYCAQAGASAGESAPGYPCPSSGCLKCPPSQCLELLSPSAHASGGVFSVKLKCNLATTCQGVFLLCLPALCNTGRTAHGGGGRLAGSDFTIPANQTADVGVALTDLGEQVAELQGGYRAQLLVDVKDYGIVTIAASPSQTDSGATSGAAINITSSDTGHPFPGGASASCGGDIFVGPNTSCGFAKAVQRADSSPSGGSTDITATSPATHQTYTMHCTGDAPTVCSGGNNAKVIFY